MKWLKKIGKVYKQQGKSTFLLIKKELLREALKELQARGAYRISSISGYDNGKEIEIIYHFDFDGKIMNLKTVIERKKPKINTITNLFPGAELYERELAEMFGIEIVGHPNLKKLFLDASSPKKPLRKEDA
jgi:NADH-quinone oxidoreductase subunit C